MLVRELKLKLTNKQESNLKFWLLSLQSIYNWAIRKIDLNARNNIYFSSFDFQKFLNGHSSKLGIPSHTIRGILSQAHVAWDRCFKRISRKPRLKGYRNKLRSIPFPDPFKAPSARLIYVPGLGKVKFFKQKLPEGKLKCGRIIKRASGWYLQLTVDANHSFAVESTKRIVGIDTGFKNLAALSDGTVYKNPRELWAGARKLAQSQRAHNKKLTSRLYERQANRRKDRNHKISRKIVQQYSEIYITRDDLSGQSKRLGKAVLSAGIGQLRNYLRYKSHNGGRKFVEVPSFNTTKTCSYCEALTGPAGWGKLAVRYWECSACGAQHDRDINAARVVLKTGLGYSHEAGRKSGISEIAKT